MLCALFRSPKLVRELEQIEETRERLEEALPSLGPGESHARQALGLIEEVQQFLRVVVPPTRWPKRKKRKEIYAEEAIILAQNSLKSVIASLGHRFRLFWGEREKILSLLEKAVSLCASAELKYLFYLGLPKNYRLHERIKWGFLTVFCESVFIGVFSAFYYRAFHEKSRSELWFEELLTLGVGFAWRFLAGKLGPKSGVWWRKWQYIWRSLAPYFVFLLALGGVWFAVPDSRYPIGLTAVFTTGLAFSFFWQALRALRAPKNALIRCTRVCHSIFVPMDEAR